MAKFTYRFDTLAQMQALPLNIPGLHVDSDSRVIAGDVSALEAAGADVRDIVAQLYKKTNIAENPNIRAYQLQAAEWLVSHIKQHGGAILADDMGLGKTRTAIYTALQLANNAATLIVAPASVALQWKEEAALFGVKSHVLGPKAKYKKEWIAAEDDGFKYWYIVSPNMAGEALNTLPTSPSCIILDEPHMYLRGRTGKWAWEIVDSIRSIPHRIAVTGTPMYNTPRDLWMLLFILFNMRFGKAKAFDARYCDGHEGTYGWMNTGATNMPELKKRLAHYMLRRTAEDVLLELPDITTSFRWVSPTKEAQAAMLQSHGSAHGVDGALDKCLTAKVPEVVSVALTLPGPCVIWTYHPHHAVAIARELEESKKPCTPITGEMSVSERHACIQAAAQNGTSLACTIDSCGTGVNMQGVASTAIFHTIQRIPKKTHQTMKRLHRSGQKNHVHNIFIAMKDAMDEIVVDTVIKKLDYWNDLMGKDDIESNVGGAVRQSADTEDAILRAIYEEMKDV